MIRATIVILLIAACLISASGTALIASGHLMPVWAQYYFVWLPTGLAIFAAVINRRKT